VRADPNPDEVIAICNCQCAVDNIDSCRPESSNLFELQRGVPNVFAQEGEGFICSVPDFRWQGAIALPEFARSYGASKGSELSGLLPFAGLTDKVVELT